MVADDAAIAAHLLRRPIAAALFDTLVPLAMRQADADGDQRPSYTA